MRAEAAEARRVKVAAQAKDEFELWLRDKAHKSRAKEVAAMAKRLTAAQEQEARKENAERAYGSWTSDKAKEEAGGGKKPSWVNPLPWVYGNFDITFGPMFPPLTPLYPCRATLIQ